MLLMIPVDGTCSLYLEIPHWTVLLCSIYNQNVNLFLLPLTILMIVFAFIFIFKKYCYLWGQPLQIFWSEYVPPIVLAINCSWPNDFRASSNDSTSDIKNSTASCCSRKFTGSPWSLQKENKLFWFDKSFLSQIQCFRVNDVVLVTWNAPTTL